LGYAATLAYGDAVPKSNRDNSGLLNLLKQVRAEAGLTQAAMARKLAQPQSFVSKYESGERRLDVLELRQVCRACGITLAQFVQKLEKAE
jgi:transcriptional regulator with XRE-family HTH domain